MEEYRDLHKKAWILLHLLSTRKGVLSLFKDEPYTEKVESKIESISILINSAYKHYQEFLLSRSLLSLYYMSFKLMQSLIVRKSTSISSLTEVQNSSSRGHGIKTYLYSRKGFPNDIWFWYPNGGMLFDYLKLNNWHTVCNGDSNDSILKKIEQEKLNDANIFNIKDLLNKIPEISIYRNLLNITFPHYFRTSQGPDIVDPGSDIYYLDDRDWNKIPFEGIKKYINRHNDVKKKYQGINPGNRLSFSPQYDKVFNYSTHLKIPLYNYWVLKLGKISDMLTLYFTLLYILSIISRYYPAKWQDMIQGKNSVFPFIETYLDLSLNGISTFTCNQLYNDIVVV